MKCQEKVTADEGRLGKRWLRRNRCGAQWVSKALDHNTARVHNSLANIYLKANLQNKQEHHSPCRRANFPMKTTNVGRMKF